MEPIVIDGGVELVRDDDHDWDWWTIERATHNGRRWTEQTGPSSFLLRYSGRISDACVEGDSSHMIGIAKAIRARGTYRAKRCAVEVTAGGALLWSPRNSQRAALVSIEAADDLASQIEQLAREGSET